jgi:hypothetical protein
MLKDQERWMELPQDENQPPRIIILDIEWYIGNQAELDEWMQQNLLYGHDSLVGMVLTFSDESELLLWILRWAGRDTI